MTQLEKFAHGWISFAEGLVAILTLGYCLPPWTGNHYDTVLRKGFANFNRR
jgi:hypothetical protein